jgi:hypothetical protein
VSLDEAERRRAMLDQLDRLEAIVMPLAEVGDVVAADRARTIITIRSELLGLYATPVDWTARRALGLD